MFSSHLISSKMCLQPLGCLIQLSRGLPGAVKGISFWPHVLFSSHLFQDVFTATWLLDTAVSRSPGGCHQDFLLPHLLISSRMGYSHLAAGYSCLAVSRGLSQGLPFCHISPWSSVCSSGKHTWFLSPYRWGFPNLNHFGLMPKPNKFQCSSPSIFSPLGGCTPRGGPRDTCAGPCLAFGLLLQTVLVGGQHGGGHRDRISYPNPASALGSPGSLYAQVHHMPLSLSLPLLHM